MLSRPDSSFYHVLICLRMTRSSCVWLWHDASLIHSSTYHLSFRHDSCLYSVLFYWDMTHPSFFLTILSYHLSNMFLSLWNDPSLQFFFVVEIWCIPQACLWRWGMSLYSRFSFVIKAWFILQFVFVILRMTLPSSLFLRLRHEKSIQHILCRWGMTHVSNLSFSIEVWFIPLVFIEEWYHLLSLLCHLDLSPYYRFSFDIEAYLLILYYILSLRHFSAIAWLIHVSCLCQRGMSNSCSLSFDSEAWLMHLARPISLKYDQFL